MPHFTRKEVFSLPYIKVDVNKINDFQQNLESAKARVSNISNKFVTTANNLDWDVKNRNSIYNKLQKINNNLYNEQVVLWRMSSFMHSASVLYADADSIFSARDLDSSTVIAIAAAELNLNPSSIHDDIEKGLYKIEDVAQFIDGKAKETNKFIQNTTKTLKKITGSSKVLFTMKDGYVIVSQFTRNSKFNSLVQKYHNGTGIGTRYTVDGLKNTPVIGTIYKAQQIAEKAEKIANTVTAITSGIEGAVDMGVKINDIWANDELSKKDKIIDTTAVALTSVVGTAIDVAAPFVGSAVTAAIPIPIVNVAVGQAVTKVMEIGADVIRSEAVINQVSDSIEKVGDAISAGASAISDAGKKLLESKNAGEAIANTAILVGTAVVAKTAVVGAIVAEGIKTVTTVAVETAKAVVNNVVEGVKNTAKKVKNFFKKW